MKFARTTLMALTMLAGTGAVASAQPYPVVVPQRYPVVVPERYPVGVAPPGWAGPHYYYGGRHWHHRAWAYDRFRHGYWRYY